MFIKLLTSCAFLLFFFVICSVGFQTESGLLLKAAIASIPYGDKVIHFSLICCLTALLNAALEFRKFNLFGFQLLLGSLLTATGITLEEISQAFIPSRNFEIIDMLCNYAGVFAGGILGLLLLSRKLTVENHANDYRKTLSIQAIFNRTRPLHHESRHRRRAVRGLG
jgi:hypothetical protein